MTDRVLYRIDQGVELLIRKEVGSSWPVLTRAAIDVGGRILLPLFEPLLCSMEGKGEIDLLNNLRERFVRRTGIKSIKKTRSYNCRRLTARPCNDSLAWGMWSLHSDRLVG